MQRPYEKHGFVGAKHASPSASEVDFKLSFDQSCPDFAVAARAVRIWPARTFNSC
jgi:hypothetical protein